LDEFKGDNSLKGREKTETDFFGPFFSQIREGAIKGSKGPFFKGGNPVEGQHFPEIFFVNNSGKNKGGKEGLPRLGLHLPEKNRGNWGAFFPNFGVSRGEQQRGKQGVF